MQFPSSKKWITGIIGLVSALAFAGASAQTPDPAAAHTTHAPAAPSASTDPARLQAEVSKLRAQLSQLEQRMQTSASGAMAPMQPKMKGGMGMMDDDMGMPMGQMKSGPSMSMPSGGSMGMGNDMMSMMKMMHSGMHDDDDMMGMGAMGGMNSPAAMATPSALPGFPGQSHLYHIGTTDFFLDHPEHITLTTQQQQALAKHKQQSLAKQGELQRQIDAAEQALWQLTAADQPQASSIEQKAREIERLRADKRIAFIRSVGDATKVLTDEQRQQLTGMAPAQPAMNQAPMSMPDASQQKPAMDHM